MNVKYLFLFLPLLWGSKGQSQEHPLKTLEKAYIAIDQKDYKTAETSFQAYFKTEYPTYKDYYLTAVAFAQLGDQEKALAYADSATTGIETLSMMLADKNLSTIHAPRQKQYDELLAFYAVKKKKRDRGLMLEQFEKMNTKKISLYSHLALGSQRISFHDTLGANNQLKEAMKSYPANSPYFTYKVLKQLNFLREKHPKYFQQVFTEADSIERYKWYIREGLEKPKAYDKEQYIRKLFRKENDPFIDAATYYNGACFYSLYGDYEMASRLLVRAVYKQLEKRTHLLEDKDLLPLFKSSYGQKTLQYILSVYMGQLANSEAEIIACYDESSAESNRLMYDYLASKDFESLIPKLFKKYTATNDSVYYIPHSRWASKDNYKLALMVHAFAQGDITIKQEEPVEDKVSISSEPEGLDYLAGKNSNSEIRKNGWIYASSSPAPAKPKQKEREIFFIAGKRLGNTPYIEPVGLSWQFKSKNKDFLQAYIEGKIPVNQSILLQKRYFENLIAKQIEGIALTKIGYNKEANMFFGAVGEENIADHFYKAYNNISNEQLLPFLLYIDHFTIGDTRMYAKSLSILRDKKLFNGMSDDEEYELKREMTEINNLLYTIDNKRIRSHWRSLKTKEYLDSCSQLANACEAGWNEYKKTPPYSVPEYTKSKLIASKPINKEEAIFFYNNKQLVYYNPSEKTVQLNDTVYKAKDGEFIQYAKLGDSSFIFSPNHHYFPDHFMTLTNISEKGLMQIQTILKQNLNLQESEYIKSGSGFNILYDQFFVFDAFGKNILIWHDNSTLYSEVLDESGKGNFTPEVIHAKTKAFCTKDSSMYGEIIHYLNAMQAKEWNGNFYVLFNGKMEADKYCKRTYYPKSFLMKFNSDFTIDKKAAFPDTYREEVSASSNPLVHIETTAKSIFAFNWPSASASGNGFYQVFNKNLDSLSTIIPISPEAGESGMRSLPATFEHKGNVYIAYSSIEDGETYLKLSKLTTDKRKNKDWYIATLKGNMKNIDGYIENGIITITYSQNRRDNYNLNTVQINLKDL